MRVNVRMLMKLRLGHGRFAVERKPVRLLTLHINEPLPGQVLPLMAEEHGHDEAARRYRAIVVTTLRQLRGLTETRLRIVSTPDDAAEAVRFWLLPRLADRWQAEDGVFRTDGWEIDFGGETKIYRIVATGEILCPFLCARWVHTALLGMEHGSHRVIGPASEDGEYLRAERCQRRIRRRQSRARRGKEIPIASIPGHRRTRGRADAQAGIRRRR